MVSRRNNFRKNTLRRRKVKRRGHSRRQRGGSSGPMTASRPMTASSPMTASRPMTASSPMTASRPMTARREINIYLNLTGSTISNPSCDVALSGPISTAANMITVNFKSPIKFAGATWSKWNNGSWSQVGKYLTTIPNLSYVFSASTATRIKKIIKKPTTPMPLGAANIYEEPVNGISTSSIIINNITGNNSSFAAGVSTTDTPPGVFTSSSPSVVSQAVGPKVNIKITLITVP